MPAAARLVAWVVAWALAAWEAAAWEAEVAASGLELWREAHLDIFSETGTLEDTGQRMATPVKVRMPRPPHLAQAHQVARTRPVVLEAPGEGSKEQVGQTLVIMHTFLAIAHHIAASCFTCTQLYNVNSDVIIIKKLRSQFSRTEKLL